MSNPLNVVITTAAMDKYLQIFALLFKIKRLEYVLVNTWKHHLTAFHSVKKLAGVPGVLHQCHLYVGWYLCCACVFSSFALSIQHEQASSNDIAQRFAAGAKIKWYTL